MLRTVVFLSLPLVAYSTSAGAQNREPRSTLVLLQQLNVAVTGASDALAHLADSVRVRNAAGERGQRSQWLDPAAQIIDFMHWLPRSAFDSTMGPIGALATFLHDTSTTAERRWQLFNQNHRHVFTRIDSALTLVTGIRSDFVVPWAQALAGTLLSPESTVLAELQTSRPPSSPAELAAAREVLVSYYALHNHVRAALAEISEHVARRP